MGGKHALMIIRKHITSMLLNKEMSISDDRVCCEKPEHYNIMSAACMIECEDCNMVSSSVRRFVSYFYLFYVTSVPS